MTEYIVRPHWGVVISVVIGSVGQPSWIGAPVEIFKQISPRGVALQLVISFISYLAFVSLHTFFFPYKPPSPSCLYDLYCITFEWTTSYAYDTTLPCSLFHNPLSLQHSIHYTLFFLLEQAFELPFIRLSLFWALSISCWAFTYFRFLKWSHFLSYLNVKSCFINAYLSHLNTIRTI